MCLTLMNLTRSSPYGCKDTVRIGFATSHAVKFPSSAWYNAADKGYMLQTVHFLTFSAKNFTTTVRTLAGVHHALQE